MHLKMCLSCAEEVLLTDVQVMVVVFGFWRSFCSCSYSPLSLASSRFLSYFLCVPFVVLLPIFVFPPHFHTFKHNYWVLLLPPEQFVLCALFWGGGMKFELFLESCGLHFGFHFKKQRVNTNPLNPKSII